MRRNPGWAAALVVAAAAGLLLGGTTAFGENDPTPKPITAEQHYSKDMTLEEISAASKGKPGEVIPPCPDAEVIAKLKAKGLPSGPCDPLPEGEPMILPLEDPEPAAASLTTTDDGCPLGVLVHNVGTSELPTQVNPPCTPGAQLTAWDLFVNSEGRGCAKLTYRATAKAAAKTATACIGDPRDPTKPSVTNEVG